MNFNQKYDRVDNVYNVGGDLFLTKESSRDDFVRAVTELRRELREIQGVDPAERTELDAELEATVTEASRPEPPKDEIVNRLSRVSNRLKALGGVASAALDMAIKLGNVASWAGTFL